ncbi:MAG: chromosome segregation protein SMC [Thermodesulfobacteriota bacterium]
MRLKELSLCGFKSFPEKASIAFPDGICGIVGPNGCGKSNIVDAICWVTGEQSVKQLRGKAMEDVIFAGSNGRPSMNMAEVSITFANNNGSAPEEYRGFSEIMVTRRLYRSGESAYLINKRPCRLKDIQHLLMGSGVGARTYSVIQQGNIGAITEAGPEERRVFVEEAAGVTRYKARKKEAQQKMEMTRQNLLRVMDIIVEVERAVNSTKRQAQKAERYKQAKTELDRLEVAIAAAEHDRLSEEIARIQQTLTEISDHEMSRETALRTLDAAMEKVRERRLVLHERIAALEASKNSVSRRLDARENEIGRARSDSERLLSERDLLLAENKELLERQARMEEEARQMAEDRSKVAGELARVREEISARMAEQSGIREALAAANRAVEEKKARTMDLVSEEARFKQNLENVAGNKREIARRLRQKAEEAVQAESRMKKAEAGLAEAREAQARCKEAVAQLTGSVSATEANLETCRQELRALVAELSTLEQTLAKAKARLSALKRMEGSYEWFGQGVRALLKWRDRENQENAGACPVLATVAEALVPAPGFESAVESALGPALQYVLVKDEPSALSAMERLRQEGGGRAGFLPLSWGSGASEDAVDAGQSLLSRVSFPDEFRPALSRLLSQVRVTDEVSEALAAHKSIKNGGCAVVKDGSTLVTKNALVANGKEATPGILAQKNEIRALSEETARLEASIADCRERKAQKEAEARNLETELQKLLAAVRQEGANETAALREVMRLEEEVRLADRHREIVALEQDRLAGDEDDAGQEMDRLAALLGEVSAEAARARAEMEDAARGVNDLNDKLSAFAEATMDLRVSETGFAARLEHLGQSEKRLSEYSQETRRRLAQTAHDAKVKETLAAEARDLITRGEAELARGYEELSRVNAELSAVVEQSELTEAELTESGAEHQKLAGERESIARRLTQLTLEKTQAEMRRESLNARVAGRFNRELAELRRAPETPVLESPDQVEKARVETAALREKIERMGEVNLAAIEEYQAHKERYDFLCTQRDDLNSALEDLEKVIRTINRYTQEKFLETFHKINEKLTEVAPRLFEGGTAQLALTEPEKPLTTGVEYLIQPAGKKVTRMSLLSGGEKALSAIAFVFAIFLLKPASFCLLDEVDAPLDDANVFRFNDLMRMIGQQSQVIMITHNKHAMETADMLFGVTMENRGVSKLVSVNLTRSAA